MKVWSIDPNDYDGPLGDVVFDIITADTYVAGIATKLLDGEHVEPAEAAFVSRPMLSGSCWVHQGQQFDLSREPAVYQAARAVEQTRDICNKILSRQ